MGNVIQLEKPGNLYASARNAKDYTFYVLLKNKKYTKDALANQPNCVQAKDLLFKSSAIPDTNGQVSCDLSSKGKDIIKKLKDKKLPADYKGLVAVVTTSKPENKDPSRKQADVQDFTLKRKPEEIKLTPIRPKVSPSDWIWYHHPLIFVQMEIFGDIKKVLAQHPPGKFMLAFWEQGKPGTWEIKKMIKGSAGDKHPRRRWPCPLHPNGQHKSGWWGGVPGLWQGKVPLDVKEGVRYVIGLYPRYAGMHTLTVQGAGAFKHVSSKVQVGMTGRHPHCGD